MHRGRQRRAAVAGGRRRRPHLLVPVHQLELGEGGLHGLDGTLGVRGDVPAAWSCRTLAVGGAALQASGRGRSLAPRWVRALGAGGRLGRAGKLEGRHGARVSGGCWGRFRERCGPGGGPNACGRPRAGHVTDADRLCTSLYGCLTAAVNRDRAQPGRRAAHCFTPAEHLRFSPARLHPGRSKSPAAGMDSSEDSLGCSGVLCHSSSSSDETAVGGGAAPATQRVPPLAADLAALPRGDTAVTRRGTAVEDTLSLDILSPAFSLDLPPMRSRDSQLALACASRLGVPPARLRFFSLTEVQRLPLGCCRVAVEVANSREWAWRGEAVGNACCHVGPSSAPLLCMRATRSHCPTGFSLAALEQLVAENERLGTAADLAQHVRVQPPKPLAEEAALQQLQLANATLRQQLRHSEMLRCKGAQALQELQQVGPCCCTAASIIHMPPACVTPLLLTCRSSMRCRGSS